MMTAARFLVLSPFSRRWWSAWYAAALAGQSTAGMTRAALRGRPWQVSPDTVPSDTGFVAIEINSPAFNAWRTWFAMRGLSVPTPSKVPVVFLPSPQPPPEDRRDAA